MSLRLPTTCALAVVLATLPACNKKPDGTQPDTQSQTDLPNLKKIGPAMHIYADRHNGLPMPATLDAGKQPLLSWRVALLPFFERDSEAAALAKQFKLDEPWDGPTNKPLIEKMPKVYQSPNASAPPGHTFYKVFVGGGAAFDTGKSARFPESFSDGTSNTILVVAGGAPVIWTKPDDIPYDPAKPLPDLKRNGQPVIGILLADGDTRTIDLNKLSEKTLRAAITANGGEVLESDW